MTKLVCKQVETPLAPMRHKHWCTGGGTTVLGKKITGTLVQKQQSCIRLCQTWLLQHALASGCCALGTNNDSCRAKAGVAKSFWSPHAYATEVTSPPPSPAPKPTHVTTPVLNRGQDCWQKCKHKGGLCSWCGKGNLCCRKGWQGDPQICKTVPSCQYITAHHECVQGSPESTVSPAPSPVDSDAVIVCGAKKGNGVCPKKVDIASKTEGYAVRCCSDSLISGWRKNAQCDVWAESDLPSCYNAKTFSEAEGICSSNNARLCTEQEILDDCSQGSGCGHDSSQVWVLS